jgi:hypothetical protein
MNLLGRSVLLIATLGAASCTALRTPAAPTDESFGVRPPGRWDAALTFYLQDSARVEFFDGRQARVTSSADVIRNDSIPGRTPWYRVHTHGSLPEMLHVRVGFGSAGAVMAEYPMVIGRDGYFEVSVYRARYDPWYTLGTSGLRAYPLPPGVATTPSDSLYISWAATSRACFSCPN